MRDRWPGQSSHALCSLFCFLSFTISLRFACSSSWWQAAPFTCSLSSSPLLLFRQPGSLLPYSSYRRPSIDGSPCPSHTALPCPPPMHTHIRAHTHACSHIHSSAAAMVMREEDERGRRLERVEKGGTKKRKRGILLMQLNNQWPQVFFFFSNGKSLYTKYTPFHSPPVGFPPCSLLHHPSSCFHTSSPDLLFLIEIHFTLTSENRCSKVCKVTLMHCSLRKMVYLCGRSQFMKCGSLHWVPLAKSVERDPLFPICWALCYESFFFLLGNEDHKYDLHMDSLLQCLYAGNGWNIHHILYINTIIVHMHLTF